MTSQFFETLQDLSSQSCVIDCGHVPIHCNSETVSFGNASNGLSTTEIETFRMGAELFSSLSTKMPVKINVCYSDTSKRFSNPHQRKEVQNTILSKKLLPPEYTAILDRSSISLDDIIISFQTTNSNAASREIKKIKKRLKSSSQKQLFNENTIVLLQDNDRDVFAWTGPALFDVQDESKRLGGDWWLDEFETLSFHDIQLAPLAPIKKLKLISLYSKSRGILCPGTYMGQLINLSGYDLIVPIYSMNDDPYIAEKVYRGILSFFAFCINDSISFCPFVFDDTYEDGFWKLLKKNDLFYKLGCSYSHFMSTLNTQVKTKYNFYQ